MSFTSRRVREPVLLSRSGAPVNRAIAIRGANRGVERLTGWVNRGGTAVRKLFGALAAALLTLVLLAPPAEARCWWNGYRWHCHHRHYVGYAYPYYRHYGYYPYYRHYYYRPYYAYACVFPFCW